MSKTLTLKLNKITVKSLGAANFHAEKPMLSVYNNCPVITAPPVTTEGA